MFIIKMMLEKVGQCSSGKYLKVERSINFSQVNKKFRKKSVVDTLQDILALHYHYRNVPFDTDEESLEDAFSEYGKINYVKMVINPKTGQPKGIERLLFLFLSKYAYACMCVILY